MRIRHKTRATSLIALVALLAGLIPILLAPGAQADHGNGATLQVSPEVVTKPTGTIISVTATIDSGTASAPINVDFEVEGGPADDDGRTFDSPDFDCTVTTNGSGDGTCTVQIGASSPGTSIVRAWLDHDVGGPVAEADQDEARLSSNTSDCTTESAVPDQGTSSPLSRCESGEVEDGNVSEADLTDVIQLSWSTNLPPRLNCSPEGQLVPRTQSAPVTCTATDETGRPFSGLQIDGENLDGANDSDNTAAAGSRDYDDFCQTDANGSCTGNVSGSQGQEGPATVCFWIDSDDSSEVTSSGTYDPAGVPADGGQCDDEEPGSAENDNVTDEVVMEWQNRKPLVLDASPEGPAGSAPGTQHTISGEVRDQFGAAWTSSNTAVNFEFFSGSTSDVDGDTPASPDKSCSTSSAGETGDDLARCSISYTSNSAGTDRICVWIDLDPDRPEADRPTMNSSNTTCAGETHTGNSHQSVDVVTKQWATTAPPPPEDDDQGYWITTANGAVFAFGEARSFGSAAGEQLNRPVVGMAATASGNGYWLVATDGGIFSFGDAAFHGSTGAIALNQPIVGMARTKSGGGYWMVAADGGIFAFGDATFHGSTGAIELNKPIVGMAVTESGNGYWLVATDGGIFAFGDAAFHGSTGAIELNQPVVGMERTASGGGYWMVASDGGVFSFGDAAFHGSTGAIELAQPIIGMTRTPSGGGYWMGARDGGIFSFGDASFKGSAAAFGVNNAVDIESRLPA